MMTAHGEMTLRLIWPQWQGTGTMSVRDLAPEFPFDVARRGRDVVGLTIAEFIPRQVMHLRQMLAGFPLLGGE